MYPTGKDVRRAVRGGEWRGPTAGLAPGYVQANLAILPREYAFDFMRFCFLNPKPCPLLDVTAPGSPHPSPRWAEESDLRIDLPRYRLYRDGALVEEPENLLSLWRDDLVSFMLGCSFTFEQALLEAGIPVRHIEEGCNVPMYRTNLALEPSGPFTGAMVVSMRPVPAELVERAVQVTGCFPSVHGAPVHSGTPEDIGIHDLAHPEYGDMVTIRPGEVPVFWACGVTPQFVAVSAKIPMMITHAPGHMFVTDRLNSELAQAGAG